MQNTHLNDTVEKETIHNLSLDRTVFAFERTALAYYRTAATFLIAGLSLIRLFESTATDVFGFTMFPIAAYMFILGIQKSKELNTFLKKQQ